MPLRTSQDSPCGTSNSALEFALTEQPRVLLAYDNPATLPGNTCARRTSRLSAPWNRQSCGPRYPRNLARRAEPQHLPLESSTDSRLHASSDRKNAPPRFPSVQDELEFIRAAFDASVSGLPLQVKDVPRF